jgi:hypothetical protein
MYMCVFRHKFLKSFLSIALQCAAYQIYYAQNKHLFMPVHVMPMSDVLSTLTITRVILKLISIVIHSTDNIANTSVKRSGKCILGIKQHEGNVTDNVIIRAQNSAQIPGNKDQNGVVT